MAQARSSISRAAPGPKGKGLWQLQRDAETLEAEIAALEAELEVAHTALAQPSPGADFAELGKAAHDLEVELERKMERWASLHEQIEARS